MSRQFRNFREFYPYYLSEHSKPGTRALHFIGTLVVFFAIAMAILERHARWLWLAPVGGYGLAWIGHFIVEKNRPATFKHPLYSLAGDFRMFFDILTGRLPR
ncbi:MAG TPA: DUF962 domain-containing protein [Gemmatimonadales bacterium]|jgi:hypothetical protein|nr:DUF962 domain-containing protein [Gemmatimonadales bacterium]